MALFYTPKAALTTFAYERFTRNFQAKPGPLSSLVARCLAQHRSQTNIPSQTNFVFLNEVLVIKKIMRKNRSIPSAIVIPVLIYPDVREAVAWLGAAFGFVERVRIGENHRSQLSYGEGAVILGDIRGDRKPPRAGEETHSVVVRVDDLNAHYVRAKTHGAKIIMEPKDFEYGERQYTAEDLAGHQWTFTETLDDIDPASWGGELMLPK
jgi:uncharacterized glyoxalase superfamily protein PhnB